MLNKYDIQKHEGFLLLTKHSELYTHVPWSPINLAWQAKDKAELNNVEFCCSDANSKQILSHVIFEPLHKLVTSYTYLCPSHLVCYFHQIPNHGLERTPGKGERGSVLRIGAIALAATRTTTTAGLKAFPKPLALKKTSNWIAELACLSACLLATDIHQSIKKHSTSEKQSERNNYCLLPYLLIYLPNCLPAIMLLSKRKMDDKRSVTEINWHTHFLF